MSDGMSDGQNNIKEEKPLPVAVDIRKEVKGIVEETSKSGKVRELTVNRLADEEIDKRVKLLMSALSQRADLSKELDKIRPDNLNFDETGKKVAEYYSKEKSDARKKATEKLTKMDKAINKACNDGDYEDLKKFK